jgi:hypothetical protein
VPLIAVNDVELYYQPHGSGAPLVLLGGPAWMLGAAPGWTD